MWPFWGLFYPLPPLDQCWILCWWSNLCFCQHLSFQHWLGGEGGRDQFLTFMWSENSMMRSFFIAFLALKWIQKNFNSWVIVVKIPHFGRVSLWALPYGGDFLTPQMEQLAFYDVLCCFQHWNRGGGGHRIGWRGYGTDAPYLFVLTHQGQVNIWRWIAIDFCLKVVLAFYVCAHRLMHTYTSTYAYVRLNTPRIRQGASEAPLKRLWSASDASLRRLWGASEAPLRSASEAPQKRLWGASEAPQRRFRGAASAQRSSKSSAPLN